MKNIITKICEAFKTGDLQIIGAVIQSIGSVIGIVGVIFTIATHALDAYAKAEEEYKKKLAFCESQLLGYRYDKQKELAEEKRMAGGFVDRVDDYLQKAVKEKRRSEILILAHSLISKVHEDREMLQHLRGLLNSDIDKLALELRQPSPKINEVKRLIREINNKWHLKKDDLNKKVIALKGENNPIPQGLKVSCPFNLTLTE